MKRAISLVIAVLLSACGGGSDVDDEPTEPPSEVCRFIIGPGNVYVNPDGSETPISEQCITGS